MIAVILIGIFIAVVVQCCKEGAKIHETIRDAVQFPGSGTTVEPLHRCELMAQGTGSIWQEWMPESLDSNIARSALGRMGRSRRFFGPMNMQVGTDEVQIFDFLFRLSNGKHHMDFFQTVVSIKPDPMELPFFYIRPKQGVTSSRFAFTKSISTDTPLDFVFDIESLLPHRVKALFHSTLGIEALIPFLCDQKWTIEWTGERFLAYKLDRLVEPHELADFALAVSEFFEMLKLGPATVDNQMQEMLQSASQKLASRV